MQPAARSHRSPAAAEQPPDRQRRQPARAAWWPAAHPLPQQRCRV